MEYVVNEWLLDYFTYNDGTVERKKLFKFLAHLSSNDDVIIVRIPSPFRKKLYDYANVLQNDHKKYKCLKWFITNIFLNSDKCKIFYEWEYPTPSLSANLNSRLNQGNFGSDRYLFETAMFITKNEKIIITTDEKLVEHVKEISEFKLILLDDFLKKYCNNI
jgi:hypothetical protein